MPVWIWPVVALMVGGYLYSVATASASRDITRRHLRRLRREGVSLERVHTVRFTFMAPTRAVAEHLQARLQASGYAAVLTREADALVDEAADHAEPAEVDAEAAEDLQLMAEAAGDRFDIEAERPMVPTAATLNQHGKALDAIADEVGAQYYGWYLANLASAA